MTRLLAGLMLIMCGCNVIFRGALNEPCDPPSSVSAENQNTMARRRSNCQAPGSTCCRRSAAVRATLCSYPEDCYVAPYQGRCITPVDCLDGLDCVEQSCVCPDSKPLCGQICCAVGQVCLSGNCENGTVVTNDLAGLDLGSHD